MMMRQIVKPLFLLLTVFLAPIVLSAAIDVHDFSVIENGVEKEARYRQFIDELRCPKCQNQNLSGSNSPIAQDLRRELFRMVLEDKSDNDIKGFMVNRYGNFVLYDPPMDKNTLILWGAPAIMLFIGLIIALLFKRTQRLQMAEVLSEEEKDKLASILQRFS